MMFIVILSGLPSCTAASSQDDAIRTVRIYDLLRAFPRAELLVENANYVGRNEYRVNGEVHSGLFLHPASSVIFPPVRISRDSVLTFKFGIEDNAWDKDGDGVEFSVAVRTMNGAVVKVLSRYIDPKHNAGDRRWFDESVPLRQFGDREIRIVLSTAPGPANDYRYDWSVFAEPEIVLGAVR